MQDEKRRAYGEFMALTGDYVVLRARRDEAAGLHERRRRKFEDEYSRVGRTGDNSAIDPYQIAKEYLTAAEVVLRDGRSKLELVLADIQLIAPETVTIAAEDIADLLYEGKPSKEQTGTFIRLARLDLGAD